MADNGKKKVLVVDDSVVVRKILSETIPQDRDLEVVGTAFNGRVALNKYASLKPDIVLLDIEMPEMNGLETIRELRKIDQRIPIVMFSSLTEHGAAATLEALTLGATDYLTKPSGADLDDTIEVISRELIPRLRALCHLPDTRIPPARMEKATDPLPPIMPPRGGSHVPVKMVAIGLSTGGPDALAQLLPTLPASFPVPLVIAQHMPPIFTSQLATRLTAKSSMPVRECVSGEPVMPGCAVIAPGDSHMVVSLESGVVRLRTHQGPKENFCRPSVDVLFRSIAQIYGAAALAVILTGMGQDGFKGCEMLRGLGAQIYAQDEASSVVWGMPGFVARAGLADKVLPLQQIGPALVRATTVNSEERTPISGLAAKAGR
jgi:two-component system, chemotaxis family, protein-glutamate methylesterase/glutaminase